MRFNIAEQLKQPGKAGHYRKAVPYGGFEHMGRKIEFAAPLDIDAAYNYDGEGFTVTGTVTTVLVSECSKCGKQFDEPFKFSFDERFERSPGEESEAYPFTGEELDLSQMVLSCLLLELPMYSLCKPDCKGLCPRCGCDLNLAQCDCAGDAAENPFSKLKALLDKDKEV